MRNRESSKVWILYVVFFFRMNLSSIEHFLAIFVITFGWVQQQSNSKPTQKWWQKCSRNVQLIRGSFGKEILLIKSILTLTNQEKYKKKCPDIYIESLSLKYNKSERHWRFVRPLVITRGNWRNFPTRKASLAGNWNRKKDRTENFSSLNQSQDDSSAKNLTKVITISAHIVCCKSERQWRFVRSFGDNERKLKKLSNKKSFFGTQLK